MDRAKLEALEKLLAKATPGPWLVRDAPRPLWCVENEAMHTGGDDDPAFHAAIHYGGKCDAELISAMHEALPALLRLARSVADADRAEVREVGGSLIASTLPAMCSLKAGDSVLILRADAADTTAGEGGNG